MEEEKKDKKEKTLKTWPMMLAGVVFIFMMGTLLLGHMSKNFYGSLSSENELSTPEVKNISGEGTGLEDVFNQIFSGETNTEPEESYIEKIDLSGLGPVETYLAIKGEATKIESLSEFISFVEAYGDSKSASAVRQLYKLEGIIDEEQIMSLILSSLGGEIKSTELLEQTENKATIKVILEDDREAEARMVLEEGIWKLGSEG